MDDILGDDWPSIFTESERKKFLIKFEFLCKRIKNISNNNELRHSFDINEFVQKMTENLIYNVSSTDFQYEKLIATLPWRENLYKDELCLKNEIFCHFITEYLQIFPNRCENFLELFLIPILFGDHSLMDDTDISERELSLFTSIKDTLQSLFQRVNNFEFIFVELLKKRYPYLHQTNAHGFKCYIFNIINSSYLVSLDNSILLLDFLFTKLIEIDLEHFFKEFNVNDSENTFDIEMENKENSTEEYKESKIIDFSMKLLFDSIDNAFNVNIEDNSLSKDQWNPFINVITSAFFQRILEANSIHCQYLIFYICTKSSAYCDILINDLWILTISTEAPILLRQSSFNLLITLFLNANFLTMKLFSFLKLILQWLNSFLDEKVVLPENFNEHDLIYYCLCIGFCQLFCVFHNDLLRNQIDCLKNMDMKRVLLNSTYKPLNYLSTELRDHFVHLSNYYRIGYANLTDINNQPLGQAFSYYCKKTCHFGTIYLPSIKQKLAAYVYDLETMANSTNENIHRRIRDELSNQSKPIRSKKYVISTSDDGMTSPNTEGENASLNNSFILNHMLSDSEMIE